MSLLEEILGQAGRKATDSAAGPLSPFGILCARVEAFIAETSERIDGLARVRAEQGKRHGKRLHALETKAGMPNELYMSRRCVAIPVEAEHPGAMYPIAACTVAGSPFDVKAPIPYTPATPAPTERTFKREDFCGVDKNGTALFVGDFILGDSGQSYDVSAPGKTREGIFAKCSDWDYALSSSHITFVK